MNQRREEEIPEGLASNSRKIRKLLESRRNFRKETRSNKWLLLVVEILGTDGL
jgi:hypothetical protein